MMAIDYMRPPKPRVLLTRPPWCVGPYAQSHTRDKSLQGSWPTCIVDARNNTYTPNDIPTCTYACRLPTR